MGFGDVKYDLQVIDARNSEQITSGVLVFVYNAGTKTLSTIYSSESRVAKTNPISRSQFGTDQKVSFWSAQTSVDIFIADDKGNVSFIPSVTPTDHTLKLDRAGVNKCMIAPFTFNNNVETDTGLDFPLNSWIHSAMVETVDTDATETIDVGLLSSETAGDANGILAAVPISSAVFTKPWTVTDTTTEDYVTTPYWGALMGLGSAGTSAANDFGQPGGVGHVISGSNAKSLTYTCSAGSDTATGYIYVFFRHLR